MQFIDYRLWLERRQGAHLKVEATIRRHNVQRRAALDHSDLHRGERRIKTFIVVFRCSQALADLTEATDQARRLFDGVHAIRRIGRMARCAMHMATHRQLAFVT
ncbi:hypothetical protein D3C76_1668620 [compost metagenome]